MLKSRINQSFNRSISCSIKQTIRPSLQQSIHHYQTAKQHVAVARLPVTHALNQQIHIRSFVSITNSTKQSNDHHLSLKQVRFQHQNARRDNQTIYQLFLFGMRALARYLPFLWRSGRLQSAYRSLSQRNRALPLLLLGLPACVVAKILIDCASFVPYTNRFHFTFLGPETEMNLGETAYQEVLSVEQNRLLSPRSSTVQAINRVCAALIEAAVNDQVVKQAMQWEVNVIESNVANAFVLPNGRIFVYTGILPIAQSTTGLAVILGHEISHALAHHSVEKMGTVGMLLVAYDFARGWIESSGTSGWAASLGNFLAGTLIQTVLPLAHSRKMENEADQMGVILMAKAGYDPREGVNVWSRMQNLESAKKQGQNVKPPEFLSTHPSSETRIKNMQKWGNDAFSYYEAAKVHHKTEPIPYRPSLSPETIARMDAEADTAMLSFQASSLAVGEFGELVKTSI